MARKPNYSFEKNARERAKAAKREAKREKKAAARAAKRAGQTDAEAEETPGGDAEEMYRRLHQRLAALPDDTVLFPGHLYSPEPSATLGETRARNYVFRMRSIEDWRRFHG